MRTRSVSRGILVLALCLAPALAAASGFHLYEQGAKASGQAVAFVARADDVTACYYNPAAIANFSGGWLGLGGSFVMLGETTFQSDLERFNIPPLGLAPYRDDKFDMEDHTGTPIHVYYVQRLGESPWAVGLSLTTPFGLITDWPDKFAGRFTSGTADLQTLMWNVNLARSLGHGWSAALGVDYIDAELSEFSRNLFVAVPVSTSAYALFEPKADLSGNGSDWSWNAAVHWKNDDWAFGFNYRHGFSVELDGQIAFSNLPTVPLQPWNLLFPNGPGRGTLDLPATMAAGVAYTGLERWEFEFDVHRITWSDFEKLAVDLENEGAVGDILVPENWDDTTSFRLGASWDLAEAHQLRFGAYTEDSPIPLRYLRPSIPDSDRVGYTLGYGFKGKKIGFDVYWMHIELDDVSVTANDLPDSELPPPIGSGDVPLGSYESKIDLYGATVSFKM
ncbi:MAG: outer membrane protein transport protein [Acidobacteria bacterium]|nr:outer membrane protein transport protein [Acidobacteriota bacterium]